MGFLKKLFGLEKSDEQESVSPREYLLREVESALGADSTVSEVARLPEEYGLRFKKNGEEIQMFLDNLFAETRELSPEHRAETIRRFLGAFQGGGASQVTWEEAQEKLLPVVRSATFGTVLPAGVDGSAKHMVERRTIPFLRELLVLDLPDASMYVQQDHLKEWGVTEEEAFTSAFANLDLIHEVGVELQDEKPSPLWSVDSNDTYEASRLLHPGFLASFSGRVKGRPVAAIPTRAALVITGDGDPAQLSRLCEFAEREFEASPRGITPALYTVDDAGRVVPYLRRGDDELAQRVRRAHVRFAMGEYTTQKEQLEAWNEANDVDVFVASFGALVRKTDDRPITWCSWGNEVDSLLPETDVVALQVGEKDFFMVPFREVKRLATSCLAPVPTMWPPRHRTTGWPADSVIEQLRAAQVDFNSFTDP